MTRQRVEAELAVTALTVNAVDGLRAVYFLRVVKASASEIKFRVKRLSPAPFFTCKRHRRKCQQICSTKHAEPPPWRDLSKALDLMSKTENVQS